MSIAICAKGMVSTSDRDPGLFDTFITRLADYLFVLIANKNEWQGLLHGSPVSVKKEQWPMSMKQTEHKGPERNVGILQRPKGPHRTS